MYYREKERVHRAGVVPYSFDAQGNMQMLFMRPALHEHQPWMQDKDFWQIAKGRIDDTDLSTRDAALREAKEELGLWEGNIIQAYELGTFLGRTTIFAAEVEDASLFSNPDPLETAGIQWMSEEEFMEVGRPLHKNVVSTVVRMVKEHHGILQPVEEVLPDDYDEFENPMALDKWGNRVNYDYGRHRRRRR